MSYRTIFGARLRELRAAKGWSQSKTAACIPLSQKHLSRLEHGDIAFIDRYLLIRLGEILETPLMTGELNQWLHAFGYRPHLEPLLPLPDHIEQIVRYYNPWPVAVVDIGRYIRLQNRPMHTLFDLDVTRIGDITTNWLWQYFYPEGKFRTAYPADSAERVLNRLFWDWEPFYLEPWNINLRTTLETLLGLSWESLQSQFHIPSQPVATRLAEPITISRADEPPLQFHIETVDIPSRPDLYVVVYHPDNHLSEAWCESFHGDHGTEAEERKI